MVASFGDAILLMNTHSSVRNVVEGLKAVLTGDSGLT
jgi:hypothetical protein